MQKATTGHRPTIEFARINLLGTGGGIGMNMASCNPHRLAIVFALAALLNVPPLTCAAATTEPSIANITPFRRVGCQRVQEQFDRVVADYKGDPEIRAVNQRLATMDQLADSILNDLRLNRSAFLDQSLATVGSNADRVNAGGPLGAERIVAKYHASFDSGLPLTNLKAGDRAVAERYLDTAGAALNELIQSRARSCISAPGVNRLEIVRLAFVMEMLAAVVNRDFSAPAPALPAWMSGPPEVRELETFAVESNCPRVAFALTRGAAAAAPKAKPDTDAPLAYLSYAKREADAMLRNANYKAALFCLRDGIAVAKAAGRESDEIRFSFRAAEVLETTDSASVAAEEMSHVQAICHGNDDYGRATSLRLKYLFEAGRDQTLLDEASNDVKEPRCAGYLPQLIFTAWIASTRMENASAAVNWRKQFLDRFPDHPLAAEIYFAAAMDALTANHQEEASRLLRFIQYRFPQSRIAAKVQKIEGRLSATSEETARAPQ